MGRYYFNVPGGVILVVTVFSVITCHRNETPRAVIGTGSNIFRFPWLCTVTLLFRSEHYFVGTCTIIQAQYVVVSLTSMINTVRSPAQSLQYYYLHPSYLSVSAGMHSLVFDEKTFYQRRKVSTLYVPNVSSSTYSVLTNPKNLQGVPRSAYGIEPNLGLLKITLPFIWSSAILPIPIFPAGTRDEEIIDKIYNFKKKNERNLLTQKRCVVASWRKFNDDVVTTDVIFIPDKACSEAYCINNALTCLKFPDFQNHNDLMCFKSLLFLDLCSADEGAALYCESFNNQVVGILTTATGSNCGSKNLPNVYTSIHTVAKLYFKVTGSKLENLPNRDMYTTPSPPTTTTTTEDYIYS